jgi:hypothetical protein
MVHFNCFSAVKSAAVLLLSGLLAASCNTRGGASDRAAGAPGRAGELRDEEPAAAAGGERAGTDSVIAYIEGAGRGYAVLEPIHMKLVVKNPSDRKMQLTFPTAQGFDFIIRKGRETVWSWSWGRMFAQVLGEASLAPGDSLTYEYTWNGFLPGGKSPELGRYTMQGVLMTTPRIETGQKEFGLID